MYAKLLQFELSYQFKKPIVFLSMAFFLFFGFVSGGSGSGANANTFVNSPYWMSFYLGLATLIAVFAGMFFCVFAMLRDKQYQMDGLVYSTSVKKLPFFVSRFLGAWGTTLLAASMFLVGFMIPSKLSTIPSERFADFQLMPYLWAWLVFVLPNVLICTSILFLVTALVRKAVATYITAVLLYGLYFLASIFLNSPILATSTPASPEGLAMAALIDPLGLSAFFEQTQLWTSHQKNTQLVSLTGYFLWNRVIWMGIGAVVLLIAYRLFNFRKLDGGLKKRKGIIEENHTTVESKTPYFSVKTSSRGFQRNWSVLTSLISIELKGVFNSLPFMGMMAMWAIIIFTEIYSRIHGGYQFDSDLYPTTDLMVWMIKHPLIGLGTLLIVFYSGELMWKEKTVKFQEIKGTTPTSNLITFLSKYVVVTLLPIILIVSAILIAVGQQISVGYYNFEWELYLGLFCFSGLQLLFFALFSMFIQTLVSNKYLGMLLTGLVLAAFSPVFSTQLGLEHPLSKFLMLPTVEFTDMAGYTFVGAFFAFAGYWGSLVTLLVLLAFKMWQRGVSIPFGEQVRLLNRKWSIAEKVAVAALGISFLSFGTYIYYQTCIDREYITAETNLDRKEQYERKYKQYEGLTKVAITDIKTEVTIHPEKAGYLLQANYVLENQEKEAVDTIFVIEKVGLKQIRLENSQLLLHDKEVGVYLFKLDQPLLSGEQSKLYFEVEKENNGFDQEKSLVKNGMYLPQIQLEPALYYSSGYEISNNLERKKRGLPYKEEIPESGEHLDDEALNHVDVSFETVISTAKNYTAIASGNLLKKWQEGERNFFRYQIQGKGKRNLCYFSAKYETLKAKHRGIEVELYYHQGHEYNIDYIMDLTKKSLDYCIDHFGPYPHDHIRIAEIPNHWYFGGQAMTGTISMTERGMYLIDLRNQPAIDLVARRVIHEVAHQWWGHTVTPKNVDGGSVITESLAKYTEAVVLEQLFGKKMSREMAGYSTVQYLRARANYAVPEVPLYLTNKQGYLVYTKGYTVMYALKELLGEQQVNTALANLTNKYGKGAIKKATSLDLIDELYQVSDSTNHQLIDDWMKQIIIYDLKIDDVVVDQLPDGMYEVTLQIESKRVKASSTGEELPIMLQEHIPIGLFTQHPSTIKANEGIVYLEDHYFDKDQSEIKIKVKEKPSYVGIDPFQTRIEVNQLNNLKKVVDDEL